MSKGIGQRKRRLGRAAKKLKAKFTKKATTLAVTANETRQLIDDGMDKTEKLVSAAKKVAKKHGKGGKKKQDGLRIVRRCHVEAVIENL